MAEPAIDRGELASKRGEYDDPERDRADQQRHAQENPQAPPEPASPRVTDTSAPAVPAPRQAEGANGAPGAPPPGAPDPNAPPPPRRPPRHGAPGRSGAPGGGASAALGGAIDAETSQFLESQPHDPRSQQVSDRTMRIWSAAQGLQIENPDMLASVDPTGFVGDVTGAFTAPNPYTGFNDRLNGIATVLNTIRNVTYGLSNALGKIGLILTVIGFILSLFGVGAILITIGRVINVITLICDAIAMVAGIALTGISVWRISQTTDPYKRAELARQALSDSNRAASNFVNVVMGIGAVGRVVQRGVGAVARVAGAAVRGVGRVAMAAARGLGALISRIGPRAAAVVAAVGRGAGRVGAAVGRRLNIMRLNVAAVSARSQSQFDAFVGGPGAGRTRRAIGAIDGFNERSAAWADRGMDRMGAGVRAYGQYVRRVAGPWPDIPAPRPVAPAAPTSSIIAAPPSTIHAPPGIELPALPPGHSRTPGGLVVPDSAPRPTGLVGPDGVTPLPAAPPRTASPIVQPEAPRVVLPEQPRIVLPEQPRIVVPEPHIVQPPGLVGLDGQPLGRGPNIVRDEFGRPVSPMAPTGNAPAPVRPAPDSPRIITGADGGQVSPRAPTGVEPPPRVDVTPESPLILTPEAPRIVMPESPRIIAPGQAQGPAPRGHVTTPGGLVIPDGQPRIVQPDFRPAQPAVLDPGAHPVSANPRITLDEFGRPVSPTAPTGHGPAPVQPAPEAPRVVTNQAGEQVSPHAPTGEAPPAPVVEPTNNPSILDRRPEGTARGAPGQFQHVANEDLDRRAAGHYGNIGAAGIGLASGTTGYSLTQMNQELATKGSVTRGRAVSVDAVLQEARSAQTLQSRIGDVLRGGGGGGPAQGNQPQAQPNQPANAGTPPQPAQPNADPANPGTAQPADPAQPAQPGGPEGAAPAGGVPYWPSLLERYQQDLQALGRSRTRVVAYKESQQQAATAALQAGATARAQQETSRERRGPINETQLGLQQDQRDLQRSGEASRQQQQQDQQRGQEAQRGQTSGQEGASAATSAQGARPPEPRGWWARIKAIANRFLAATLGRAMSAITNAFTSIVMAAFSRLFGVGDIRQMAEFGQQQAQEGQTESQQGQGDARTAEAKNQETQAEAVEAEQSAQQKYDKAQENIQQADQFLQVITDQEQTINQEIEACQAFLAAVAQERQRAQQEREARAAQGANNPAPDAPQPAPEQPHDPIQAGRNAAARSLMHAHIGEARTAMTGAYARGATILGEAAPAERRDAASRMATDIQSHVNADYDRDMNTLASRIDATSQGDPAAAVEQLEAIAQDIDQVQEATANRLVAEYNNAIQALQRTEEPPVGDFPQNGQPAPPPQRPPWQHGDDLDSVPRAA